MNRVVEIFGRPRVLLPVIHCLYPRQVDRNVEVALANGADGVFLINQGGMDFREVRREAFWHHGASGGDRRVGVNLLGIDPADAMGMVSGSPLGDGYLPMLWCDDAGVNAEGFGRVRHLGKWTGLYFGSVAFKYQSPVAPEAYGLVALTAAQNGVDVVTTSGPATGSPPAVDKIRVIREALGDHALAIASGITPENVGAFLPYADAFLVATGIEETFGVLDPVKLKVLADIIHGRKAPEKAAE